MPFIIVGRLLGQFCLQISNMATKGCEIDSFHRFVDTFMVVMVYVYGESSLTGTFPYMAVERTESGLTFFKLKITLKKKKPI